MAVVLGYQTLQGVLTMREVIDLLEQALVHEAAGKTELCKGLHHFQRVEIRARGGGTQRKFHLAGATRLA